MTAGIKDIFIEQGATWDQTFTYMDGDSAENLGNPIDLSNYTARAQIRKSVSDPNIEIELTTENGRIELGGPAGTIHLHLTAEETEALSFISGVWDLELVTLAGTEEIVLRLLQGNVTLSREVTK